MSNATQRQRDTIAERVKYFMKQGMGRLYVSTILSHEDKNGVTIKDRIVDDVLETSGWETEGCYSDDDIKRSIGSVIAKEMGAL